MNSGSQSQFSLKELTEDTVLLFTVGMFADTPQVAKQVIKKLGWEYSTRSKIFSLFSLFRLLLFRVAFYVGFSINSSLKLKRWRDELFKSNPRVFYWQVIE